MTATQPAGVTGVFYPADPQACGAMVQHCLDKAHPPALNAKAVISPHAGFVYSGEIAGEAYRLLGRRKGEIKRVVIFGPNHRVALKGMAISPADAWATPFGPLKADWSGLNRVLNRPDVTVSDVPFRREHSLEVQLPFIRQALGDVEICPVLVGDCKPEQSAAVLHELWGGPETAVVISSDLSHYHDYATAQGKDHAAGRAIELLRSDMLKDDQACGRKGIYGLIELAKRHDMRCTTLDIRNSGDTHGGKERVVGYGSFAFEYALDARLDDNCRSILLDTAQKVVRHGAATGSRLALVFDEVLPRPLRAMRACFVTLTIGGKLRGCIGSLAAHRPLIDDVADNAWKAAFGDPRFPALRTEELEQLEFHVSVLSGWRKLGFADEADLVRQLRPDIDGLIIRDQGKRAIFLPGVWEGIPDPKVFLTRLKQKAGLGPAHWSPTFEAWRYSAEAFGPEDLAAA
jgi:AmmeMemoRadiSam system protein B/AmmeMemoRadiSam system protein A